MTLISGYVLSETHCLLRDIWLPHRRYTRTCAVHTMLRVQFDRLFQGQVLESLMTGASLFNEWASVLHSVERLSECCECGSRAYYLRSRVWLSHGWQLQVENRDGLVSCVLELSGLGSWDVWGKGTTCDLSVVMAESLIWAKGGIWGTIIINLFHFFLTVKALLYNCYYKTNNYYKNPYPN